MDVTTVTWIDATYGCFMDFMAFEYLPKKVASQLELTQIIYTIAIRLA